MAYPVNIAGKGSVIDIVPDAGVQLTKMSDGTIRGFSDYDGPIFRITIRHFWMSEADANTVKAYYDADPYGDHTVVTEMEGNYSGVFVNRPAVTEKQAGNVLVVSELIGPQV